MNKVILIGRVGKEPESKQLAIGAAVSFSLATSERYKQDGEKKEITQWHNCTAYRQPAELISKHVHKGDQIMVEGKLTYRSYEAKNEKRYITEVIVDRIEFISQAKKSEDVNGNVADEQNDLPF